MTGQGAVDWIHSGDIATELANLAARDPGRRYARVVDRDISVGALNAEVDALAAILDRAGVGPGARVAVALSNTVVHVALVFALMRRGALWVPLNPKLKGLPLTHLLSDSATTHLVAVAGSGIAAAVDNARRTQHGCGLTDVAALPDGYVRVWRCDGGGELPDPVPDTSLVMYTSGTTGPPKGVRVTQTMLRAAAIGAAEVTDVRPGDVLYLWEPIFHIGGAQTLLIPLLTDASLALTPRFSASRFWSDVRQFDVTHIHYLGGVLQMLLRLPETRIERDNRVRVAWGAGATQAVRDACRRRFRFALHETYGMTETSSIVTANSGQPDEGVGRPLPWFDVRLDGHDEPKPGATGEILVRGRVPGLLTPGYLSNATATRASHDGEWFRTGDIGRWDEAGALHFEGRASDSIRVRGENVSAWQVEDVFARHPDVDRCAVVGVSADVGEQEMMLVVATSDGRAVDPWELTTWAGDHLAAFQLPRYVKIVDEMPLTPSQRVAKAQLPKDLAGAVDCTG